MYVFVVLSIMPVIVKSPNKYRRKSELETVSIAEPLQNRQHAQNP